MDIYSEQTDYSKLTLRDLLEAREQSHNSFINKKNVVATAIGRYLIRLSDIDKNGKYKPNPVKKARTLENSAVADLSWNCILVFVKNWEDEENLKANNPTDLVPKYIQLEDGRYVPVCVVEAPKETVSNTYVDINDLRFPENLVGGGFPLFVQSQGIRHVATVGCLVTDGHKYYALTNKHVAGVVGEKVTTVMGKVETEIGISSGIALGKVDFNELYGGLHHSNTVISCDAGLIDIHDVSQWKTDVIEIGQMDELYDLNAFSLNLGLIAEHKVLSGKRQPSVRGLVVGYGAVSKKSYGEIAALFYRYKSVGGTEYVSDFLISGRNGESLKVRHGDSGMVWHLEMQDKNKEAGLHPIALHWGQHEFIQGKSENKYSYSLSTSLSNICRELDVELVRGWNINNDYSWGGTGHYKIAALACDIVSNKKLKKLLAANKNNIAFEDDAMLNKGIKNIDSKQFCPLADVPDLVWRNTRKLDEANHFADMDESNPNVIGGKTLLEACKNSANINVDFWNQYYEGMEAEDSSKSPLKRGALPFRVWQAFDLMADYAKQGKLAEFVCVGGLVSHYLGDACQPLHISYLHHGHPGADESKVHATYETQMMDSKMQELFDGVNKKLLGKPRKYNTYKTGKEAAEAVITLMDKVYNGILSPEEIIDTFNEVGGRGRIKNMWEKLGDKTIKCVAEGSANLALFWESAWAAGGGDKAFKDSDMKAIGEDVLTGLYNDKTFFPSYRLKDPQFKEALK